jgi:tetratricopeptide (TPR) repeat protein
MLATNIFNLLIRGGEVLAEASALAKVHAALQYELRLETFLEILAEQVSPEVAFQPFESLQYANPCFAHFAILELSGSAVITTNQDILFERAVRMARLHRRIIHLHGRCDRIGSIVTIISQYLGGLDRSVRQLFCRAIMGKDVLVFGYSGRDRDVMPVLLASEANSITWLLHDSSRISPELERARAILGKRLTIKTVDSDNWLENRLNSSQKFRIRKLKEELAKDPTTPQLFHDYFSSITFLQRNRAVARVLEHLGAYADARAIYQKLCKSTAEKDAQLVVDLARVTARTNGHEAGRSILLALARRRNLSLPVRVELQLDVADALRNSSRARNAKRVLANVDQLLSRNRQAFATKEFYQSLGRARNARAGIERLEGKLEPAQRLYAQAERAFSKARDIDGRIDVLTWQSETALIRGDIRKALSLADAAIDDAIAYARVPIKAWPSYVKAEGLVLSGRYEEAKRIAQLAHSLFKVHGNVQGVTWTSILEIDCLKDTSWRQAMELLKDVRGRLGRRRLAHAEARLFLEEADLARLARNWSYCAKSLSKLHSHVKNPTFFSQRPRMIEAHASLVEAECARDQNSQVALEMLQKTQQAYKTLGASTMAMRTAVAIALLRNENSAKRKMIEQCMRLEYSREVQALCQKGKSSYPIQFV